MVLRHRIDAAGVPGVAAANALERQPAAPKRPVFRDRLTRIFRTAGIEPTRLRKQGRDEPLITSHHAHE